MQTNKGLTLAQFAEQEIKRVRAFKAWYEKQHKETPRELPPYYPE